MGTFQSTSTHLDWTRQAKDCYDRKCICKDCIMSKILETKCQMKYTVIELVRQCGKPPKEYSKKLCPPKEPSLTKEFILNQLHQGKTLKQIAKENGFSKGSVSYWSKYIYKIDARHERKENTKWDE